MIYIVGLIVFSAIASFAISDSIALWKDLKTRKSLRDWLVDISRLLIVAAMAGVGYFAASTRFQTPRDGIAFLAIGLMAAVGIYLLSAKR